MFYRTRKQKKNVATQTENNVNDPTVPGHQQPTNSEIEPNMCGTRVHKKTEDVPGAVVNDDGT